MFVEQDQPLVYGKTELLLDFFFFLSSSIKIRHLFYVPLDPSVFLFLSTTCSLSVSVGVIILHRLLLQHPCCI